MLPIVRPRKAKSCPFRVESTDMKPQIKIEVAQCDTEATVQLQAVGLTAETSTSPTNADLCAVANCELSHLASPKRAYLELNLYRT